MNSSLCNREVNGGGGVSFRVAGIIHAMNTINWSSSVTNDAQILSDMNEAELQLIYVLQEAECFFSQELIPLALERAITYYEPRGKEYLLCFFMVLIDYLKRYQEQQLGFSMALPLRFCAFMRDIFFLVRPFTPLGDYYKYLTGVEIYFTGDEADSDD